MSPLFPDLLFSFIFTNMIKYTKYGLASRSGNIIELHQDLKQKDNSRLKNILLQHERHHSLKGVTVHDFVHDWKESFNLKTQLEILKFMISRPSTWWAWSPIRPFNGGFGIDFVHGIISFITIITLSIIVLLWLR